MRVAITGATGNIGASLVRKLSEDPQIEQIVGIVRRPPTWNPDRVVWHSADVVHDDLRPVLQDVDVLVHLAWLVQPSRDEGTLWDVNVRGTSRTLAAAADAGVPGVVYVSSVGAYSPGPPNDEPVDETWPTDGVGTSSYSRAKAYTERCLDAFEATSPSTRVVRLRPALIFKREAADRIRRLFLGTLFPTSLLRADVLPIVPWIPGLTFQAVHADDIAEACRLSVIREVSGAFNLAADPVLDLKDVAGLLRARPVPVPAALVRPIVAATWAARLHPIDVGWLDLARAAPTMETRKARRDLGWQPTRNAVEALAELVAGIRDRGGGPTPPLRGDRTRLPELTSRQGASEMRP